VHLSHRIRSLTENVDGGWEIFFLVRKLIESGDQVINLTIGEHDITTHKSILQAMDASARGGDTGYAAIPGVTALRERVASRFSERTGVQTTLDNVLITAGGQAALFAAHHAVCDENDVGLYIDPHYPTYPGIIRAMGAIAKPIKTRSIDGFRPTLKKLTESAKRAKSLLINSPNNPTGAVYDQTTLTEIANVVKEYDLWLISDEVYDTQVWNGVHISPRALPEMRDRTFVIGSVSKSHAMTGFRCGWVVGPKDAIKYMINLATHTNYGIPGFIQNAAIFALDQGEVLENDIAAPFRRRKDLAFDILTRQQAVIPIPSDGAMYLMLDIRATGLSGREFARQLLHSHRIAIMPGESFGSAAAGHIRVAMTVDDEEFMLAIKKLCDFAASLA